MLELHVCGWRTCEVKQICFHNISLLKLSLFVMYIHFGEDINRILNKHLDVMYHCASPVPTCADQLVDSHQPHCLLYQLMPAFPHYVQVWRRSVWTAWYLKPSSPSPWCSTTLACCSNTDVSSCPGPAAQGRATWPPGWLNTWWTAVRARSHKALQSLSTCTASHARWHMSWWLRSSYCNALHRCFVSPPPITVYISFSHQELQLYLSNLANQIDRETSSSEVPLVVILDDIHDPVSISELVNGALTCKYHKW